jgi:hypothetical protein
MASLNSNNNVDILVKSTADNDGIESSKRALSSLDDKSTKSHDIGKKLGEASSQASLLMAGGFAVATAAGVDMLHSFQESENVGAQLEAVLKSTGGAAHVTKSQLDDQSAALQKMTMFSDEAVGSVQAMLLTFTNIKGGVMTDATKTVLDMSQALGQDTKSSAIQLGKALNDPITGISALQRVGVTFTQSQKDVIKHLVDTGKTADAQKVILKELNTEFGGSATSAGKTFSGQMTILANQIDNVKESVGGLIMQGLQPLIAKATAAVEAIDWTAVITNVINTITRAKDAVMAFLKPVIDFIGKHKDVFIKFLKDWALGAAIVLPIMAAVAIAVAVATNPLFLMTLAVGALIFIWDQWHVQIMRVVNNVIGFFVNLGAQTAAVFNFIGSKIDWFKNHFWEAIGFVIGFFATLPIKLPILMFEAIAGIIGMISRVNWGSVFGAIGGAFGGAMNGIKDAFVGAYNFMTHINWGALLTGIGKGVGNAIIDLIQGALNGAFSGIPGAPKVRLPHFARGVQNFGGGMAIVGEEGPEAIYLPQGSSVKSASQTRAMGGANVTIGTVVLGSASAVDRFFTSLDQDTINVGKGLTPARGTA